VVPALVILVVVLVAIVLIVRGRSGQNIPTVTAPTPNRSRVSMSTEPPPQNVEDALALLATCVHPRETGNLTTVVQVHVADPVPAEWHLDLDRGNCSLVRGRAGTTPLALTASARTWTDVATKRLSFASAYMNGSLRAEGDTSVLWSLDGEFSGPPDPSRRSSEPLAQNAAGDETSAPIGGATTADAPGQQMEAILEAVRRRRAESGLSPADPSMISGEASGVPTNPFHMFAAASSNPAFDRRALQEAIRKAVQELPPGASRQQKAEAIRAALGDVPNAGLIADALARHRGEKADRGEGIREELAGALLEGILGSLFDGS
jgi:hypothetical protein